MNLQEALSQLWEKLQGWGERFVLLLPNLIIAILVIILFWIAARIVKQASLRIFTRVSSNVQIAWLVSIAFYILVFIAGVLVALGVIGLDKTVTSLLAGAGLVGLAMALAFQDLGQNLLAGIYIGFRQTIRVGDVIKTNDYFGTVREINLRSTHLNVPEGQIVIIPNREIFENPMVKYSTGRRRVDLDVGISYGDDLEKARRVTIDAVKGIAQRDQERDVELFYKEFGDSSINFVVRFWIPFSRQPDYLAARSEAVMRIKKAFDENGITIPFPIRTLDFGIVGGEKLSEVIDQTGLGRRSESDGERSPCGEQKRSESG